LKFICLIIGKVLLTPAPSIDNALFYKLDPKFLHVHDLSRAATKSGKLMVFLFIFSNETYCFRSGTAALGTIVNLTAVGNLHVDIVVVASVVVNPITGARLGKGKGYGDIEYAMMRQLGACDDTTLVVTTVHESQLLDDLPSSVMTEHDLYVYSFFSLFFLLMIDWILDQLMLLLHHNE
jgi:5-formyltetrahydrofolate cyclo-ligase